MRHVVASLLLASIIFGCSILSPATEIRAENHTGELLDILSSPCGSKAQILATLRDGESHTWQVDPGCYHVEGWVATESPVWRIGVVDINVPEGTLHVLPFYLDAD